MRKMRRVRRVLSAAERRKAFRRWRAGASYVELAKLLQRSVSTVWSVINPAPPRKAGYPVALQRARKRNDKQLSEKDREEVSRGLASGR